MAEHKACADLVAVTGDSGANSSQHAGECVSHSSPSSGVDDSGTESGEDIRLLSPEILAEVQTALTRLESALPGLDPVRREALIRLVTRLQSCLKLQPPPSLPPTQPTPPPNLPSQQVQVKRFANRRQRHQRHTVGVSKEELADARRWLIETGQQTESTTEVSSKAPSIESESPKTLNEHQEKKPAIQIFRPVRFNPNKLKALNDEIPCDESTNRLIDFNTNENSGEELVVLGDTLNNSFLQEVPKVDSGSSLLEYDPSLVLFTPAQSVQIAVHKAAINKQISEEENKRETSKRDESYDSDDEDRSSVDEEHSLVSKQEGLDDAISSAQRLLQIATDNKKTPIPGRFRDRSSKKQKMKRANTIDIPKPTNFYEMEGLSPDEFTTDEENKDMLSKHKGLADKKLTQPTFQPKTENDLKFLAFLQQTNKNEGKMIPYNPSAKGGQPWTNRFVNIKTSFEGAPEKIANAQNKSMPASIAETWLMKSTKDVDAPMLRQAVQNRSPQPLQNKSHWNSKQEEEEGIVIGSLTVKTSPSPKNKFFHAPKSAFKPIEKKLPNQSQKVVAQVQKSVVQPTPIKSNRVIQKSKMQEVKSSFQRPVNNKVTTSATGTVKQMAAEKFSGHNITSKPIIKQYPVIQDKKFNATPSSKQHPFDEQKIVPFNWNVSVDNLLPPQQFSTSIASAHRQFNSQPVSDSKKLIKYPQKTQTKNYKDESEHYPANQYINSPSVCKKYSEPFEYLREPQNENQCKKTFSEQKPVPYYSQQPSYVQHSTYTQPLTDYPHQNTYPPLNPSQSPGSCETFPFQSESSEEYPVMYEQQQYNTSSTKPDRKQHLHGITDQITDKNISSVTSRAKSPQLSVPFSQIVMGEQGQHRFSEESLVPNPLVLGEVYKPSKPLSGVSPYEPYSGPPNLKCTPPFITNNLYESNSSQGSLSSSKLSDSSSSLKHYLNIPCEYIQDISPVINNSPYHDENVISSGVPSPHWNSEDVEDNEISLSEGTEMHTAVARVMGQAQCQKAVTVSSRTQHRHEDDGLEPETLLRALLKSPHSPTNILGRQSLESSPPSTESPQVPKSPMLDKSMKNKFLPDIYPVLVKPSVVENDKPQSIQSKPLSLAASAFRPLVKNLSKPTEPDNHRPPIPPYPSSCGKKLETDNRFLHVSNKYCSTNSILHSNKYYDSELPPKPHSVSPSRSPSSTSPSFPNVLQKSESWHQLVKEQMSQGRHPPPKSPRLTKTKSSHTLAFPKQFEAHLSHDSLSSKQSTVDQYLKSPSKQSGKMTKQLPKPKKTVSIVKLDDNLENVDEAFESLFQEVAKRK